ncbi:hypothetical protein C8F04DRAFT_503527 [Mycena alexandri]|uniref:Uncharacterized protein n=1 Tax=Mycena alexandri TaxID=1745969 RepID=A0AAD6RY07_9AGAR|nr:hypothetical protein C8F04DRAFT_503527 [Mycena alexandri]
MEPDDHVLEKYAMQFRHLELYSHLKLYSEEYSTLPSAAGLFPSLETLSLRGFLDDGDIGRFRFDLHPILKFLKLTPTLVECALHGVLMTFDHNVVNEHIVLPNLTGLKFQGAVDGQFCHDTLLRHLTLPSLETLTTPFTMTSASDFFLFLTRSSPPLRKLVIGNGDCRMSCSEWLHLVPSLVYFELFPGEVHVVNELFTTLAESPSLLPHLQTLRIHDLRSHPLQPAYPSLL